MTKIWHPEKSIILDCIIGDDSVIHAPVWIGNGVVIGRRCKIQAFAFLPSGVQLGDDVFIGPHVCFTNDKYPPSGEWLDTVVGDKASIGAGVIITPGVTIGREAMIGAGALITKDVPAKTLVKGVW